MEKVLLVGNDTRKFEGYLQAGIGKFETVDKIEDVSHLSRCEYGAILFCLTETDIGSLPSLVLLKQNNPSIPIIIVSEDVYPSIALWCLRSRIRSYIVLPDEIGELREQLKKLSDFAKSDLLFPREMLTSPTETTILGDRYRHKKTRAAIEYIERHFAQKIKVSELAGLCNLSPQAFLIHFKAEHGKTVRDHLKLYRLGVSKMLLSAGSNSIGEIAYSSGYGDVSHFIRVFKDVEGCTPAEFRKNQVLL